jgi:N-sulfoglucosamine sulfohydrolase
VKRSLLLFWLAVSVLSALPFPASARQTSARPHRPNILFAIADDWSWPHAGAYGDRTVATPTFDRVAREGARFTHAFTVSPSCTPSRAAILTGQAIHRLAEGGNLHGFLPARFAVYPDLLEAAGYFVGPDTSNPADGRATPPVRSFQASTNS